MNAPQNPQDTSYDEVAYLSRSFPQTHPDHLAVIASMFGMNPPPVSTCRVLELGCASGGNLLPMAGMMPDARFVGVDLSVRQVEAGQAAIAETGLRNIELKQFDITQIDRAFGEFDYIIAHGVYSWVPAKVRDHLLRICNENLSPNGVAYVSYNVYPGWRLRGMVRDMMLYHARQFPDLGVQVQQARALLDFLAQNVATENNPFGMLLKQELQSLRTQGDWYLTHEHLERVNEPVYFHDFVDHAGANGLQYLGESEFHTMLTTNFSPAVAETLQKISNNIIRSEQYMDFLRNRAFRQTLLVHGNVPLNRNLDWKLMSKFYVSSRAAKVEPAPPINSRELAVFRTPLGVAFNTPAPIVKAAMTLLAERAPLGFAFDELLAAAQALVGASPPSPDMLSGEPFPEDGPLLGSELLKIFAGSLLEFRMAPLKMVTGVGDKPKASDIAVYQASHDLPVTNLKHEHVELDHFNRQLLARLDGDHDRRAITDALVGLAQAGVIVIASRDNPEQRITAEPEVRKVIAEAVEYNLSQLAKNCLLEA